MTKIQLVNEVGCEVINVSASDNMVAMSAWVSNDADAAERLADEAAVSKLISFLYRNKHMSPFEHGLFTFKVDVPLFVAREFHRHRTASYNEVSGRYTEMKPRFWCGDEVRVQQGKMGNYYFVPGTPEQTELYHKGKKKILKAQWKVYQERLEAGVSKEQAREDMPLSMMTQFYVTMNPRNLMQFLTLRNDSHALKEIREIAVKMEAALEEHMPATYRAYLKGRDNADHAEAVKDEVIALKNELLQMEQKLAHITGIRESNFKSMMSARQERDEAYKVRDEAVSKYNAHFVAYKESEPQRGSMALDNLAQFEKIEHDYTAEKGSLADDLGLNELLDRIERLEMKGQLLA